MGLKFIGILLYITIQLSTVTRMAFMFMDRTSAYLTTIFSLMAKMVFILAIQISLCTTIIAL